MAGAPTHHSPDDVRPRFGCMHVPSRPSPQSFEEKKSGYRVSGRAKKAGKRRHARKTQSHTPRSGERPLTPPQAPSRRLTPRRTGRRPANGIGASAGHPGLSARQALTRPPNPLPPHPRPHSHLLPPRQVSSPVTVSGHRSSADYAKKNSPPPEIRPPNISPPYKRPSYFNSSPSCT